MACWGCDAGLMSPVALIGSLELLLLVSAGRKKSDYSALNVILKDRPIIFSYQLVLFFFFKNGPHLSKHFLWARYQMDV